MGALLANMCDTPPAARAQSPSLLLDEELHYSALSGNDASGEGRGVWWSPQTCEGCRAMHEFGEGGENQLAHMQPGGCLYEGSLPHNKHVTSDEDAYSVMAHASESIGAPPSAADAASHADDTLDASMTPDNVLRDTTPDNRGAGETGGIASNAENLRVWRHLLERQGLCDDADAGASRSADVSGSA